MLVLAALMILAGSVSSSQAKSHSPKFKEAKYSDGIISEEYSGSRGAKSSEENAHLENRQNNKYRKSERKVKSASDGVPGTGHRFPFGQCTWYVAQKKYIPWSGNAGTWLHKAKNMGYATGRTPEKGAIAVFGGSYFGHVALVESVRGGQITLSEMNYKGVGKVSYRNISAYDPKLIGFIY